MKTKTIAASYVLSLIFLCSTPTFSQILTVTQINGSADTEANAVDLLVNNLTDVPLGNCNFPVVQAGLWGSSYGVVCGASANQEGTLPFHHETHCHTGSRAFLTGDQSQAIKIIWKSTVSNFSTSDAYWAAGESNLTFNASIGLDQSPPGVDVTVYYHYSAFVGASTDHETDGFLILEEDPIDVQTTLTLGGNDLLPTPFDFQNPDPNGGGVSGWNSVKDVYGSLIIQQGQDFALAIGAAIEAEINPLGKPWAGPFETDQSDGIFMGQIIFSVAPFIDIPVQTSDASLLFSLDIGSDSEYGDPYQDGDEQFDPGDVYFQNSLGGAVSKYLDDQVIFGMDPLPDAPGMQIPYHGIPMDAFGPDVFDLDGFEVSDWNLDYWADQLPMIIEPSDCTPYPDHFLLSFDDDGAENWSDPFPSLPVESPSPSGLIFGETSNRDEVVAAYSVSGGSSPHVQYPLMNEGLLHNALAPDPLFDIEDDDCDALAIDRISGGFSLCPFQYFSVDREGRFYDQNTGTMLNPGSIYQVMGGGIINEVLTPSMIGILDGTDIDAFTFGALPNDNFATATFALYFSVDQDDPMTPEDESGGLNPNMIYYSILNGAAWELSTVPFQDDIDGMTLGDASVSIPSNPCADIYYQDNDGDGYGDSSTGVNSCSPIPGYVSLGGDCDDNESSVHPGAIEICDNLDNNCDGVVDDVAIGTFDWYYPDNDGDGYGAGIFGTYACIAPAGQVADNTDCDDLDADVYPGAPGTNEGKDNDCDGVLQGDETICMADFNGDGVRNTSDLLAFISYLACNSNCGEYDLNGDGVVDSLDLLNFLSLFGTICP